MNKFSIIAATGALAAALAFGQTGTGTTNTPPTPPDPATMAQMRVDWLARTLNLTDAQKTQAQTIFLNAITASQALRTEGQTLHESLVTAIKANNNAGIDQVANELAVHDAKTTAINAKAEAAFYLILTADQQANYHVGAGGGRPGFGGGPGGPPPGGGMSPNFRGGPRP
jgi:Spy/CpxP family protein refolding chaperone